MGVDLQALQQRFGSRYPGLLLTLLMVASMAMILASTSINLALPAIMRDFAIGRPLAQWLSTGFLAAMTAGCCSRLGPRHGLVPGALFYLRTRKAAQPLLPLALWQHAGFRSPS